LAIAAAFVGDAEYARAELEGQRWDVIVAGVETPASAGVQLLASAELNHPNVARLAHSKLPAARDHVGAHMFLTVPFSARQLRQALYGTVRWKDRLGSAAITQLVAGARELPSIPEVYRKIQTEMNSDDPSMRRVGEIVQADAATSIRILRVVNSALFGLRTEVGDVVRATALLGMRAIGSLALAASTFADSSLNQRFLDRMWTESITVGALARTLALDLGLGRNDLEESQLGGLLHDIGQFVLFKNWPDDFAAVDPVDRDRSELGLFGATHADIGGYLTAVWELPLGVVDAVTNHHTPSTSRFPDFPTPATVIHVARALMDAKGSIDHAQLDVAHLERVGVAHRLDRRAEIVAGSRRRSPSAAWS
jgi:HD-like signal output (HDOD) protein